VTAQDVLRLAASLEYF